MPLNRRSEAHTPAGILRVAQDARVAQDDRVARDDGGKAHIRRPAQSDKAARPTAPLILRKPSSAAHATTTPTAATPSTPAVTPQPASSVIARTAAPSAAAAPHRPIPTPPHDIDWIAEQVGQRIARRLEIERERLGVRSWRP
jgi:hypothetical protein